MAFCIRYLSKNLLRPVFSTFTVEGAEVTTAFGLDTNGDWVNDTGECIVDGAFSESTLRSAPYFSLRIDGITELTNE